MFGLYSGSAISELYSLKARPADPRDRYFRFLSRLSAGGRSNMYGAIPYLAAAFNLDREMAFRLVCDWVDTRAQPPAPGRRTAAA
jgi:hypothetical protein